MHELDPRTRLNTFDTEKYPLLVVVREPAQPTSGKVERKQLHGHYLTCIPYTSQVVPSVSRQRSLEKLQRFLMTAQIIVVCLPPGGGKSLFDLLATTERRNLIYVSLVDIDFVKFVDDLSQGRVTDSNNREHSFSTIGNCIVWLDDAQTQFSQTGQWQGLVNTVMSRTRGVRFVISTTSLDDPPEGAYLRSYHLVKEDGF
ncbi:hypothetical protein DFS34DRAFT_665704 [Phlyctochytrium arcticum]|nr:hypothetical protein DFS34DRAFT_665704 [Phlyctochytrium arcticum]